MDVYEDILKNKIMSRYDQSQSEKDFYKEKVERNQNKIDELYKSYIETNI